MGTEKNKEEPQINFQYLIPSKNAEKVDTYISALERALEEEDVNNIAISGSYGAGKSSFIKTFINKNDKNEDKYLDISLATFEETTKDMSLIEKSILQQIFYKVEHSEIPLSRFKRINTIKFLKTKAIIILLFILSILFIANSKYVSFLNFLNTKVTFAETAFSPTFSLSILKTIPILIILIGMFFIVKSIIRNYSGFALEKLSLQNLEIKTNQESESSLLNKYLDEILYFFSQTTYNVVIFQDLDRFKNVEIFTKLRELNNFLNNSKQVRKKHNKIVFLYAIKDSMFMNGDSRTKFFDFMIPIIPYINSSTSYEKLLKFFDSDLKSFELTEKKNFQDFLRNISLYINDMRLLKNIYNEFKIYDVKIGEQLDKVKLLAIIIYKNFYPEDFSNLHKNDGVLFNLFTNKNIHIKDLDTISNEKISTLQKEINSINQANEHINNIHELRRIYILKIIEKLLNGLYSNRYIRFSDGTYEAPENLITDENFQKLIESNQLFGQNNYHSTNFKAIEKEVSDLTYQEREDTILNKKEHKVRVLEDKITDIRDRQKILFKASLQELLNLSEGTNIFKNTIDNVHMQENNNKLSPEKLNSMYELLELLVINGHIDEDYYLYLSYSFHESLTPQDTTFIKSVISKKKLDSNFKLTNIEEIFNRLNIAVFKSSSVLNYDLINFLIENKNKYKKQYETVFEQLNNESEESIEFIFGYLNSLPLVNIFIKELVEHWNEYWIYIDRNFSHEQKETYFYLLLYNVPVETIEILNIDNSLKNFINNLTKLNDLVTEENQTFKSLIKLLNIKFYNLNEPITNFPLFSYIYENNHYKINELMIEQIFKVNFPHEYEEDSISKLLKTQNLSTIFTYGRKTQKLIEHIEQNISLYVENIILNRESNKLEDSDTIIWLLKHDDLSEEIKYQILKTQDNKLEGSTSIENEGILQKIFQENKILPHWIDIYHYYSKINTLDKTLINYLSIHNNAEILSKIKVNNNFCEENKGFDKKLLKDIIECNDIETSSYELLIEANGYRYADINFCELGDDKIEILIEKGKVQLTSENIEKLIECSSSKQVTLIENLFDTFIDKYDEIASLLDDKDFEKLFTSSKLSSGQKFILLENTEFESMAIEEDLAYILYKLHTDSDKYMDKELLLRIFEKLSSDIQLSFLIYQLEHNIEEYDCDELHSLLEHLGDPYDQLCERVGSYRKIDKNDDTKSLVKFLEEKGCISSFKVEMLKIRVNRFGN